MAFENSAVHDMIREYLERMPEDHTPVKARFFFGLKEKEDAEET